MKVLLVDDEIFTIRMLQNLIHWEDMGLELIGYAQDGQEALEKVLKLKPDIVITDIKMPVMSGLELLRRLNDLSLGIKTILVSAYSDFSYVKEAMKQGGCDYILKPIDEFELETTLRKVVLEIQGIKEQEKVISNSAKQLDKINLFHYMRTNQSMNKVLKSNRFITTSQQRMAVYMLQTDSKTIDEYNKSNNLEMIQGGYITKILEHYLSGYSSEFTIFDFEDGVWTIILEDIQDMERAEVARAMINKLWEEASIPVNVCFSNYGNDIKELPALYEEVMSLCKYRFYVGEEDVLGYGYNCNKEELESIREIGILKELESDLSETILDSFENKAMKAYTKPVVEGIKLIEEKYNQNLSLEEICNKVSVSKNYFCYLFKRETGMSIWNYLTVIRLQHAKQLLDSTDMKSYEIAFQVGYDNPSYFSKLFKKYELMTPNEYRENKK